MKSDKVRVGLWGLGRHAERRLLPAFRKCKNAVLASVHTRDSETGSRIAKQYDCIFRADVSKFLEDQHLDAVIICTPTGLHYTHGLHALSAGKHILVEKPFTHSGDSTEELFALARRKNLVAMDGLMYLFHPQFLGLKNTIISGSLGAVRSISIRFGMPGIIESTFRTQKTLGGGASLDMLCYPLSLVYQLCPTPPILLESDIMGTQNSDIDIGGWFILRSDDQIIDAHWGMELAYRNDLSIWGSKQSLYCPRVFTKEPSYESKIRFCDSFGSKEPTLITGSADAYSLMIDKFASDIQAGRQDIEAEKSCIWCAKSTDAILH
ncbi:MAG: Gfo/Idh/MocA family oxidoreductase [Paracoccaceae bacterium]|nr:Gfo/Idh/MocA family oxidoreductase [Paracoccaceae bacterium]